MLILSCVVALLALPRAALPDTFGAPLAELVAQDLKACLPEPLPCTANCPPDCTFAKDCLPCEVTGECVAEPDPLPPILPPDSCVLDTWPPRPCPLWNRLHAPTGGQGSAILEPDLKGELS